MNQPDKINRNYNLGDIFTLLRRTTVKPKIIIQF